MWAVIYGLQFTQWWYSREGTHGGTRGRSSQKGVTFGQMPGDLDVETFPEIVVSVHLVPWFFQLF